MNPVDGKLYVCDRGEEDTNKLAVGFFRIDEKTLAPMGETPMIAAAFGGREAAMELLISLGADIDKQDSEGYTPLHWAATAGRDTTISWLLTHGAEPRARNLRGETALMMSCRKGHGPASAVLAQAGNRMHAQKAVLEWLIGH